MPPPLVAIVEPYAPLRSAFCDLLEEEGYRTLAWACADEPPAGVEYAALALVILDLARDGDEGNTTLLAQLEQADPNRRIPVIVVSADHRTLLRRQADLEAKGYPVLELPFPFDDFLSVVDACVHPSYGGKPH